MNRKKVVLIFTFVLIILLAAGCKKELNSKVDVGVTIYRFDDYFMSFVRNSIEKNADENFELNIYDSEMSQPKQNEQVDLLIRKGVDVLAINLVDPRKAYEVIEKAKKAKLPLLFFNREPSSADLESYDHCWYIGTDSVEAGVIQGKMIVDSWKANPKWDKNGDGKLQYILIEGEPGHPDSEARSKYAILTMVEAGIEVEELARDAAMWDSIQAKNFMDSCLRCYGDSIEYVISNNDSMAMGAVVSLQAAGYFSDDKFMPIIGVDAIPDMLSKIESGLVVGTVLNNPKSQGLAIVELARNLANQKDLVEETTWTIDETKAVRIPYIPITIENIDVAKDAYR